VIAPCHLVNHDAGLSNSTSASAVSVAEMKASRSLRPEQLKEFAMGTQSCLSKSKEAFDQAPNDLQHAHIEPIDVCSENGAGTGMTRKEEPRSASSPTEVPPMSLWEALVLTR
jgi:hypothetical protein